MFGIFAFIFVIIFSLFCSYGHSTPDHFSQAPQISKVPNVVQSKKNISQFVSIPAKEMTEMLQKRAQSAVPISKEASIRSILLPTNHKKSNKQVRFSDTRVTITDDGRKMNESTYSKAAMGERVGDYK